MFSSVKAFKKFMKQKGFLEYFLKVSYTVNNNSVLYYLVTEKS